MRTRARQGIICSMLLSAVSVSDAAQSPGPFAHTSRATDVRVNNATLNGFATPNGRSSVAWFEWGLKGLEIQATSPMQVGAGRAVVRVSTGIEGIQPRRVYQCRLVVSNTTGIARGAVHLFSASLKGTGWGHNFAGQSAVPATLTNLVLVAGGNDHSLALKADGTVAAWGYNWDGQTDVPPGMSNVVALAGGSAHSLALKSDGTVEAWGNDDSGQTSVPLGLSNAVEVACGNLHSVALKSDGTVIAWGFNGSGETDAPANLSNVVAVAAGSYHTLALKDDGTVVGWGAGVVGPLRKVPVNLTNVVAVAGGGHYSLALKTDGAVVAWGDNYSGQTSVPVTLSNVLEVAAGAAHNLALRTDGTVAAWGYNTNGQTDIPGGLNKVVAVAAGDWHSLALVEPTNRAPQAFPQTVVGSTNQDLIISLQGNDPDGDTISFRIVALPARGTLYQHNEGQRGSRIITNATPVSDASGHVIYAPESNGAGDPSSSFSFIANDGLLNSTSAVVTLRILSPAAPFAHSSATSGIRPNSAVLNGFATANGLPGVAWFEWGARGGTMQPTASVNVGHGYQVVHTRSPISNLVAGTTYQCRLAVSNALGVTFGVTRFFSTGARIRVWGDNSYGQTNFPSGLSNIVSVAAGEQFNAVLRADGTVALWGWNGRGQTNMPAGLSNVVALAAGFYHNLALKSDGTIAAWGTHWNGSATRPIVVPAGLTNVAGLAAGRSHSAALRTDGTVAVWGVNTFGQTNVPAGLSNVVEIAAGAEITIAIKNDGTVVVWGYGASGLTNVPAGLSNAVMATGTFFSAWALESDGALAAWGDNANGHWGINYPSGVTNLIAISAGGLHVLGLRDNGAALAWGYDISGLGIASVPPGISNVIAVGAGNAHNLVLLENTAPQAFAQTVIGPANQDLVLTLKAADVNADLLSYRVTTLPAAGTLYQYSDGARGAAISSPNTTVSNPLGRLIFGPTTNTFGTPYAGFGFVANDGDADSSPAEVTLNIEGRPYAHTLAPTELAPARAVFKGIAVPNNFDSVAWFEWGERGAFTNRTPPLAVGGGAALVPVSAAVSNLTGNGIMEFRLVASNATGLTFGLPHLFAASQRVRVWGNYNVNGETNVPVGLGGVTALAGGGSHTLALKRNGTVAAWGFNYESQTNPPAGLSHVVAVAAGNWFSLALKSDGTVAAWGYDEYETIPHGLTNVIDVAAGPTLALALKSNGGLTVWGTTDTVMTALPPGLSNVVGMAAGWYHGIAVKADGTVWPWGYNNYGQTNVPASVTNCVAVAAGDHHNLALLSDGTVVGWGDNSKGQAAPPPALGNVVAIRARGDGSFALRQDGTLVAWGDNGYGQLTPPPGLASFAAVAPSYGHTAVLITNSPPVAAPQFVTGNANTDVVLQLAGSDADSDALSFLIKVPPTAGSLYQYSNGVRGELIVANNAPVTEGSGRIIFTPVTGEQGLPYATLSYAASDGDVESAPANITINEIGPLSAFTRPATGITTRDAKLNGFVAPQGFPATAWFEWGTNAAYGQTTLATDVGSGLAVVHVSQRVAGLLPGQRVHFRLVASNATQVLVGADQQFIAGGKVRAWGDNSSGQAATPVDLGAVANTSGGLSHSLALRTDGTVAAWGNNSYGQTNVPPGLDDISAIAAGGFHNLALGANGSVEAWGRNNSGQTNVPADASNVVAIAAGGQHSAALRADGSLVAWGDNSQGQRSMPASLSNVVGIAAGWYHNVALRSDSTVTAWGANGFGQSSVPAGLTNVMWVGAGLYHSLALRNDGSLVAWGYNALGQTNIPFTLSNVTAAGCGGSHNLALLADGTAAAWGYDFYGQTNIPNALSNIVQLAAGGTHSLAIIPADGPIAIPQIVTGFVNADLTIALQGISSGVLTYRLAATPALGSLYQFAGGVRGPQITAPDSAVSDSGGRVIFVPVANQVASPYGTFSFLASNGIADSAAATVTINIVLPPAPILDIGDSGATTDGAFQLAFSGATGATYRVWASTNLLNWELLGTAGSPSPGQFLFLDVTATDSPQRFYRATAP